MLNITPFRQKPGFCGPASLKMVLDFWGVKITEKKIVVICLIVFVLMYSTKLHLLIDKILATFS